MAPSPQYTEIARKARIQGVVIVEAIIDKRAAYQREGPQGTSDGTGQAAADAVKKWKIQAGHAERQAGGRHLQSDGQLPPTVVASPEGFYGAKRVFRQKD